MSYVSAKKPSKVFTVEQEKVLQKISGKLNFDIKLTRRIIFNGYWEGIDGDLKVSFCRKSFEKFLFRSITFKCLPNPLLFFIKLITQFCKKDLLVLHTNVCHC